MLIEIAGADGSGKTTLIQAARKRINESGLAFAYERPFQSEGVRLLEAASSGKERCRPYKVFGHYTLEVVRVVDLVGKSALLNIYKGSKFQHVFCDGYIVEQYGRLHQFGVAEKENIELLKFATQPDMLVYLRLPAERAVERMRSRLKGDALLLESDPVAATQKVIASLEEAIAVQEQEAIVLDATQPPDVILEEFMRVLFDRYHES